MDISNLKNFSTKASTLMFLKKRLKLSKIEDMIFFTVNNFENNPKFYMNEITKKFKKDYIIVRSSSINEDAIEYSNAGHYNSVLNVKADDKGQLENAINNVISSYSNANKKSEDQILIQKQTIDVKLSGVILTRDIKGNKPYYTINYDVSGNTNVVTSGNPNSETIYISLNAAKEDIPKKWIKLYNSLKEIEMIFKDIPLDIEFAINSKDEIIIFQVRPFVVALKNSMLKEKILELKDSEIIKYNKLKKYENNIFSDMAFWNPAEIIGDNPSPLSYSLYHYIITDREWNTGIVPLGYREIKDSLMYKFGNKPYINVNYSFLSLTPKSINDKLAYKLLNYYNKKLLNDLSAHDKIEFEIVFNCFNFSTTRKMDLLKREGFSEKEVKEIYEALYNITLKTITNYSNILKEDLKELNKLEVIRKNIEKQFSFQKDWKCCILNIIELFASIKKYATPQFSRQARCAFIAKSVCQSLVDEGYITQNEYNSFMYNIKTVASQFNVDFNNLRLGVMSEKEFLKKYGHLRAGTYDIKSKRYDELNIFEIQHKNVDFDLNGTCKSDLPREKIEGVLSKYFSKKITYEAFIDFIKTTIAEREYFKFIFTKSLSLLLEIIKALGNDIALTLDEISFIEIEDLVNISNKIDENNSADISKYFMDKIIVNEEKFKIANSLILPSVITSKSSFQFIEFLTSRPNFITDKKVKADIINLNFSKNDNINRKIILIEKADPGYDWIFTQDIAGLVTKYGGVASHMAIRCAEFGIPAAIGCGENIYNMLEKSNYILLDCKEEKIEIIK